MLSIEARDDLIQRLRKIEGQAKGIQRMLADDRDCREVLNQLASVRAATQRVSVELLKHYMVACLNDPECARSEESVSDLVTFVLRV